MMKHTKYKILLASLLSIITIIGANAQSISGIIKNPKGEAVPNAIVKLDGLEVTRTDEMGEFQGVDITSKQTLSIEHDLFQKKAIDVNLVPNIIILTPLSHKQGIQIGYGEIEQMKSTQATSAVSGENLKGFSTFTLGNRLSGKIAGLTIVRNGNEPASDIPDMFIRGTSTYNSNNILVMVDGFEATINNLLPEEIESVTVLKDAAALAIYGMRGANGVLLITTKRGVNSRVQVKLDTKLGFSSPARRMKFTDSYTYASLYNEAISNDIGYWSPIYSKDDLELYKNNSDSYFHPNVSWYDEVMRSSVPYTENTLSFTGGNNFAKYYVMLGYVSFDKLYGKNSKAKADELKNMSETSRFNFRTNIDLNINSFWSASVSIGGNIIENSKPNHSNMSDLLASTPPNAFPIKNMGGTWAANNIHTENPLGTLYESGKLSNHDVNVQTGITLNQNLDKLIKGLKLFESVSFVSWTRKNYDRKRDYERYQMNKSADGTISTEKVAGTNTDYQIDENTREQSLRTAYNLGASYSTKFNSVHEVSGLLGFTYSNYEIEGNNAPYRNTGLYGRFGYSFDNRILSEFSFAYNGSENLPPNKRFGFFPAVSLGWIVSNENFAKKINFLNYMKIRTSAGIVGNSHFGISRFAYQTYYANMQDKFNIGSSANVSLNGLQEGRIGNSDITWEKNYKYDLGVDLRLFDKLDVSADVFYEKRTGILSTYASTTPSTIGAILPYENIGKVSNKGFELTLEYSDNLGKVDYYIGGNISYAKNKIDYQAEVTQPESYLYRTGKSANQFFGLEAIGLFQSYDEINNPNTPVQLFSPVQPGDIRYKDQNGDGYVDENDMIAIGKPTIPEINYGFYLGAAYKGLDIKADLYGQANRSIMLSGNHVWAFYNNGQVPEIATERWAYYPEQGIDTRTKAKYPRLSTANNDNNYQSSTFWQRNGSFLRLQNLELGYTLPEKVCRKAYLNKIRLYVQASNLLTISSISDYDPEIVYGYPITKSYSVGLSIQF
ncbi:TonB-dependent receptor [uncultured Dysgonomonas sp.]|uniref:TonB-dependent receptor plug domain-containing protein n=1 Tax=uncultured Dysgonomonas sp. TaxID=206096 RepID=A0A212JCV1_9BACT|nr:TonB-dependent receptor [uncultured Dysgonomonas sp.]SBV97229.1 conserved exported hypothetical protein [uncultured Dysgonomonas sp.]